MRLKVVHGWRDVEPEHRGAALALGEFDGVHKGHLGVIVGACEAAKALGAPLAVISFDPHPRRYFQPAAEPFRLMTVDQQARALDALGVDVFYILPFDAEMAGMSDETFAREVLVGGLGARHVAAGFDITFGKDRTGDPDALRRYGEALGFSVSITERLGDADAAKFSSSAVRDALKVGNPERAAEILGRPFAIEGVVVEGQRTWGAPWAIPPPTSAPATMYGPSLAFTPPEPASPTGGRCPAWRILAKTPPPALWTLGLRSSCSTSTKIYTGRPWKPT